MIFKSFFHKKKDRKDIVNLYMIFDKGTKKGPYSKESILGMVNSGEISDSGLIKIDGVWKTFQEVEWLQIPAENEFSEEDLSHAENQGPAEVQITGKLVTCPHCWKSFDLAQVNFISKHTDLIGDPILGPDAPQRFLPTHFNEQGYAIDAKGIVCQDMACPYCHLRLPEAVVDLPSICFSIVGAPASGKSYFLTAMVWQLRNIMTRCFDYTFSDTDESFNQVLNNYESILFLNRQSDQYVALPKTELQGHDFSNQIVMNGMNVDLPLPFIFTMAPMQSNSDFKKKEDGFRNIVLYDNAGEHFEPGRDNITNLATMHLIHSNSITFLYDPIKDSRMVQQCSAEDPQVQQLTRGTNQLVLLNEMISRIRKYSGLKNQEKYSKPLIVVIPKYDAWKDTFPVNLEDTEFVYYSKREMKYFLNLSTILNVSYMMRDILLKLSPEVVAACETFFSSVYFVPVSALGRMPEYDPERDMIGIKPVDLNPVWAEVPMLLQFWYSGLIPAVAPEVAKNPKPITQYKFIEDTLVYLLPGKEERCTIPSNYCGFTVYSLVANDFIKFPAKVQKKQDSNAQDDEFWNE